MCSPLCADITLFFLSICNVLLWKESENIVVLTLVPFLFFSDAATAIIFLAPISAFDQVSPSSLVMSDYSDIHLSSFVTSFLFQLWHRVVLSPLLCYETSSSHEDFALTATLFCSEHSVSFFEKEITCSFVQLFWNDELCGAMTYTRSPISVGHARWLVIFLIKPWRWVGEGGSLFFSPCFSILGLTRPILPILFNTLFWLIVLLFSILFEFLPTRTHTHTLYLWLFPSLRRILGWGAAGRCGVAGPSILLLPSDRRTAESGSQVWWGRGEGASAAENAKTMFLN